jgi:hypothetical protein
VATILEMFRKPEGRSDCEDLRPHETSRLTAKPVEVFLSWSFSGRH